MSIATQSERLAAPASIPGTIEKMITLRAPRSRVWRALTDVHQFCAWFSLEDTNDAIVPGARLHMTPKPEMGCDPFYMFVEEVQPERLFSWRWHPGAMDAQAEYYSEPTTLVVFRLEDVAEGTRLTVTESGFNHISLARRAKVFQENTEGWEYQMNALKKYVGQAS